MQNQSQHEETPPRRRAMIIAAGLALIAAVIGAVYFASSGAADEQQSASVKPATSAGSAGAAEAGGDAAAPRPAGPRQTVLAFGDSLFAGYKVAPDESYPAQLEAALTARGVNAKVINAGVSGDTSAAGLQRLAFTLDGQREKPDLVIVELGGNDLLRGVPPAELRANLDAILAELQKRGLPVLLMGMRAPPNFGADYQRAFDAIYPDLAAKYNAALVPFFLEPVYDKPALIQQDRIHPTAEGISALVRASEDEVAAALPAPETGEATQ